MKAIKGSKDNRKQYWLWVTQPKYYLDDDGSERRELDPSSGEDLWGTWTCSKHTQKGDLVLLWRTKLKSDIAYLFQVLSEAYENEDKILSKGWKHYCEMKPVYRFRNPLTLSEIRMNPHLDDWGPLKCQFFGSCFEIYPEYWDRLNNMLIDRNPGYRRVLERVERRKFPVKIDLEQQMEDRLAKNPGLLKRRGYNLELIGRQMPCIGVSGRLDLLFRDKKKKCFFVVELKNVKAGQNTFSQICNYVGWVKDRIAGRHLVKGLVISRGRDPEFLSAMKTHPHISQLDIGDLGFK